MENGRPALFVDLDGTVRETISGRVHPVTPEDQVLRPGVKPKLAEYRARGFRVVGVTNQAGVAMGILSEADVRAINHRLEVDLAPGLFDLILYCPYHRYGHIARYRRESACRKPNPGMAYEARELLGIDLAASIMVGDMEVDSLFARNAGIPTFYWADEFFGPSAFSSPTTLREGGE